METDRSLEASLITVTDAAQQANVTPQAIRNAIYEGKLPARLLWGRQLIDRADFARYLITRQPRGRPPKRAEALPESERPTDVASEETPTV